MSSSSLAPGLPSAPRILLYSHDSVGLGHLRRSLTIAAQLSADLPDARLLLATGSSCATQFQLPEGLDVVKLPSVGKNEAGSYVPRLLRDDLPAVIRLRRGLMMELVRTFQPHVLLVDHKVLGVAGELEPVLEYCRQASIRTVLGIRDIIDEARVVAQEWGHASVRRALAESYDRVCVYGVPEVFDPRVEYPIPPELGQRLTFTGYLVRASRGLAFRPVPTLRPQLLVTVGGGEDGADRIERTLDAIAIAPPAWDSTIVLGPLFDSHRARRLKRRAREHPSVRMHTFYEDMPRLLGSSSAVVSMAGYNSVAEIIDSGVPAVLLPRRAPRLEQTIRAERFANLGLVTTLTDPDPVELRAAIERALTQGRQRGFLPPMDGAARVSEVICDMLPCGRSRTREAVPS